MNRQLLTDQLFTKILAMKAVITGITALLLFSACLHKKHQQIQQDITAQHWKNDAKAFILSVVNTYFEEDCETFFNAFSDSIIVMDEAGLFPTADRKEKLCRSMSRAVLDKSKTLADYQNTYQIEILTPTEFEEKFNIKLADTFHAEPSDHFFLGTELQDGFIKSDNFIWKDMFFFMVRKEGKKWVIKAVSG